MNKVGIGCAAVSDEGALQMRRTPCGCNPHPEKLPFFRLAPHRARRHRTTVKQKFAEQNVASLRLRRTHNASPGGKLSAELTEEECGRKCWFFAYV